MENLAINQNLATQIDILEEILIKNQLIEEILEKSSKFDLPNWYLVAGCIANTVWNYLHGFDITNGIKDYDLVYFDDNTSYKAEDEFIKKGRKVFKELLADIEIRNQARVHLWHEKHFGRKIHPYLSTEEGINTYPTTATTIGIRREKDKFIVYAPYGLNDLFGMIVRPNKIEITEEIYLNKIKRWSKIWPKLKIVPWNE